MKVANILDYRAVTKSRLSKFLFEYINRGSYAEVTLRRNVDAIDLSTTLFGTTQAMPIGLAPIGLAGMNARRGEQQAALYLRWAWDFVAMGKPHGLGNVAGSAVWRMCSS